MRRLVILAWLAAVSDAHAQTEAPMTRDEMIAANAHLVTEKMSGAAGFDLGYDEASLAWVSGFIDRQREGWLADGSADKMRSILGSYAGAVVIARHGGSWV